MSNTIITIKPPKQVIALPHYLLVGGQLLGIVKDQPVRLVLPPEGGMMSITVRSLYKFIEGSAQVTAGPGELLTVSWTDHERWWNVLFTIDLVLWLVKFFFDLGQPWDLVYDLASNGFFVLWLVRLWIIRKHYFVLTTCHTGQPAKHAQ